MRHSTLAEQWPVKVAVAILATVGAAFVFGGAVIIVISPEEVSRSVSFITQGAAAAWTQAIGAIIALFVAIRIPYRQAKNAQLIEIDERHKYRIAFMEIGMQAVEIISIYASDAPKPTSRETAPTVTRSHDLELLIRECDKIDYVKCSDQNIFKNALSMNNTIRQVDQYILSYSSETLRSSGNPVTAPDFSSEIAEIRSMSRRIFERSNALKKESISKLNPSWL